MINVTRTITIPIEVEIQLGEHEINYDDYSSLLHDGAVRERAVTRMSSIIEHAVTATIEPVQPVIVRRVGTGYLKVNIDPDSQAEWDAASDAEQSEYDRRRLLVDEIGDRLNIKECIWSFSPRHIDGDYQQNLIDNIVFCEGQVRFEYNDHDKVNTCPALFTNPTMEDVFMAADHCLQSSNDKHHVFVEGVESKGVDSDGVQTYNFFYGS